MGDVWDWFWAIVAIVGSVGAIVFLMFMQRNPDDGRTQEDDDREFFDRHGHWPDEDPEAIAERVRASDAANRATAAATLAGADAVVAEEPEDEPPGRRR